MPALETSLLSIFLSPTEGIETTVSSDVKYFAIFDADDDVFIWAPSCVLSLYCPDPLMFSVNP